MAHIGKKVRLGMASLFSLPLGYLGLLICFPKLCCPLVNCVFQIDIHLMELSCQLLLLSHSSCQGDAHYAYHCIEKLNLK
jgi:hypothetical protein